MATDNDTEMKSIDVCNPTVENYRKLVQTYIKLHNYNAALFWADKVVALSSGRARDVYWLGQCMFMLKQYHRAAHLLRHRGLDKKYILCNILTAKCLLEANELTEALKIIESMDLHIFLHNGNSSPSYNVMIEAALFDDTPKEQLQSTLLVTKGKILSAMDNRGLASECYKQALICDVHCYEAFECLVQHNMLTATEEEDLITSLPISQQCSAEESEILLLLYKSKLKKYHGPSKDNTLNKHFTPFSKINKSINLLSANTNNPSFTHPISISTPYTSNNSTKSNQKNRKSKENEAMIVENTESPLVNKVYDSLDLAVARAETFYYKCEYLQCYALTEKILKEDLYHSGCLPIHIACLVELKRTNNLFTLAHKLVDLYPNIPISWFAVGCYYYVINKSDSARRFLSKAASLDRLFGPAWLAYGHSFAVENEHDQAMAAYFKASQLMKGCHLPLMYIGLECGLTNNIKLAEKFFQQAIKIAPNDPFVLHEMGVVAFQNLNYSAAEKHFKEALKIVRSQKDNLIPQRWAALLNNLGHTLRKLKQYEEALRYHQEALLLCPESANTFSAIAFVYALMGNLGEAIDGFHKALSLKKDDTFSTTMLNYVTEQLTDEQEPYEGCPDQIPDYEPKEVLKESS